MFLCLSTVHSVNLRASTRGDHLDGDVRPVRGHIVFERHMLAGFGLVVECQQILAGTLHGVGLVRNELKVRQQGLQLFFCIW